jgi:membrane protein CcdC involved in cytochrome C biogenesis
MEYVMLPHLAVTVQTILKALIAAFLFAVQLVSTEYAMLLPLLVTVKATLKALTAVDPFAVQHVSMEYVMLPHLAVTVQTILKALIAAFLFAVQLVSTEYAMLLPLLVTVKATLKALTAVVQHVPVCSPACVNGVCNAATFTCDCANNFQGPDCSTPSTYLSCVLCRTPRKISKLLIGPFLLKYNNIHPSIYNVFMMSLTSCL